MSGRLEGRRALVTGAGGGLGGAIARAVAAEGAAVALLGRTPGPLHELAGELSGEGARAHALAVDVADADAAARAVWEAAERLGGLDAVVNAAAVDTTWAPTGAMPVADWDRALAVNLSGTFYVCRAALGALERAGGGAIVNVTSVAGLRAWPQDVAYNASKAGVELLTRTIAVEYGARGIRANCLAPGVIDAGMTDAVADPEERRRMAAMHPLGRMGSAAEVAEAAVWLLSSAAGFSTGSTLLVDGGYMA